MALEQWTRRLADVLGASHALEPALRMSAQAAPAAIAAEVTALDRRLAVPVPTEEALRRFAGELNDPIGDRIAAALILAHRQRGKGLRDVLTSLARMVAKDVAARREVESERATHRTTLRWLVVAVSAYGIFAALNPEFRQPFSTLPGQTLIALIAVIDGLALWWLYRLATAAPHGRFLSSSDDQREGVS